MARVRAVKAAARVAKKAYSKSKTGKKAATRKTMQARADKRAAAVKSELKKRAEAKKAAADKAWGMGARSGATRKRTPAGPPGSRVGTRKHGVQVRRADPRAKKATSSDTGKKFYDEFGVTYEDVRRGGRRATPAVRARARTAGGGLSPEARALDAATKKARAARKAAAARRRRRATGAAGAAGAAAAARRRRRRSS